MDILIFTAFGSLILAGSAVALFAWSVRQGTFDHADRLALLPMEDGTGDTPEIADPIGQGNRKGSDDE